jgi:ABC-type phosphate transport system substrate-binding protein
MTSRRRAWFLVRLVVYVTAIAVIFIVRGGSDLKSLRRLVSTGSPADSTLIIAGRDLAPDLIDTLVASYRRDYPDLTVILRTGSTNQALEDLMNRQADVAFLYRPPTAQEQGLLRTLDGDTAVVVPVAVGGLVMLAARDAPPESLTVATIAAAASGAAGRLYVPDPNEGAWDALRERLELPAATTAAGVIYMRDVASVVEAVVGDPGTLGLASTFTLGSDSTARRVPVSPAAGEAAAAPTFPNLVTGAYPLYHWLYVVCREEGGIQGTKFVTHLAGARGQRQVEKAGVVPARQVAREVILSREPLGSRGTE